MQYPEEVLGFEQTTEMADAREMFDKQSQGRNFLKVAYGALQKSK